MKYCNYCGNEIEDDVELCPKCKHSIDGKNAALIMFLKKHTKEKLIGKAEDSLFEYLKNFILSHLYGFVLTITIIAVPLSMVTVVSGVKVVNERPVMNNDVSGEVINNNDNNDNQNSTVLSDKDKEEIIGVISNYSVALENSGGTVTDELRNIWVDSNIIDNTYHHAFSDRYDGKIYDSEYIVNSELKFDMNYALNQVFTSTGKELVNMGYDIVVIDMDGILYFENHPDYEKAYPNYKVTMVKVNGRWYIAEEINTHSRWDECKDIWILN